MTIPASYIGWGLNAPLSPLWDAVKAALATVRIRQLLSGNGVIGPTIPIYVAGDSIPDKEGATDAPWGRIIIQPVDTLWPTVDRPGETRKVPFLLQVEFNNFRAPGYRVDQAIEAVHTECLRALMNARLVMPGLTMNLPLYRYAAPQQAPQWDASCGCWWSSAQWRCEVGESAGATVLALQSLTIVTPITLTYLPIQLAVAMTDTSGATVNPLTRVVNWGSTDPTIARIDQASGILTPVSTGTVEISAVCEGFEARATVFVQPLVFDIMLAPTVVSLLVGQTSQITVTALDNLGNVLTGRATSFASLDPTVATVSGTGLITGVGNGRSTTIAVTVENVTRSIAVTIQPAVASITVTPNPVSVGFGLTVQPSIVLKDIGGNVLTGRAIACSSSDLTKVNVDPTTGLLTGVALGAATITITSESVSVNIPATCVGAGPYGITTVAAAWWKRDNFAAFGNGAPVTAWADSSANGVNLVKTTGAGAAPTWDTTVLGGSVKFSGTSNNQQLENAAWTAYLDAQHLTVFAVARWDATTNQGGRTIVRTGPSFSSIGSFLGFYGANTTQNFYIAGGSANNLSSFPFNDITNPHVFEQCYDGTQVSNAAKQKLLLDGTVQTVNFGGTLPGSLGHADAAGIVLAGGSGTNSATMHIAEVIVFIATLSSADRATIRAALGAKYGITVI